MPTEKEREQIEQLLRQCEGLNAENKNGECLTCSCDLEKGELRFCHLCKFDGHDRVHILAEEILRLRKIVGEEHD